ncbi:MAG: glycosyltransferase family 39 protein [Chloroflexi bacterium]|nr:glycosyltransferase family 39 protein [Chloroflexota bacterium]
MRAMQRHGELILPRWWEAFVVVAILVGAAFLRLYQLDALPPGLYHDEAVNGFNAIGILEGKRLLYFGEREPLYMYLSALSVALLGPEVMAMRLPSALVGIATVAGLYLLARQLFGRSIALFAAAGMALSLGHVILSRDSFRAITLPLLEMASLYFLWRGLQERRLWWWALGGALLGLTLYTYIASRFFPILLVLFCLGLVFLRPTTAKAILPGILIAAVAALLVALPLLTYFVQHPEALLGRPLQVVVGSDSSGQSPGAEIAANVLRAFGMFGFAGDANWRQNYSGQPLLPWPLFLPALWGYGLAWRRLREPAYLLLVLWIPVMLIPTILSVDSPHYLRSIGVFPAAYLALGLGAVELTRLLTAGVNKWWPRVANVGVAGVLLAALLVGGGWLTYRDYFLDWGRRPEVYAAFNGPLVDAAHALATSPIWREAAQNGEAQTFITDRFWDDRATMAFLLWPYLPPSKRAAGAGSDLASQWFDEERSLPLPQPGEQTLYVFSTAQAWAAAKLQEWYPQAERQGASPTLIQVTGSNESVIPMEVRSANFGNTLSLEGYRLEGKQVAGKTFDLILFWRVLEKPATKLVAFAHLLDQNNNQWASGDGFGYGTEWWQPGQMVATRHPLASLLGTPPAKYRISVGVYEASGGQRVKLLNPPTAGDALTVAETYLDKGALGAPPPPTQHPLEAESAAGITLVGSDLESNEVSQGSPVQVATLWRAERDLLGRYERMLRLEGIDGSLVASSPLQEPVSGHYPTSSWSAGELVWDRMELLVGPLVPPGTYKLKLVLNEYGLGAQPPIAEFTLGNIFVREIQRSFTIPPIAYPLSVSFGETAVLGYDIFWAQQEGRLEVTLYWQAQAQMATDYTVFLHLLDANGRIVAQRDTPPKAGARPTTSWAPREVIVDQYTLSLPSGAAPGTYRIIFGLYNTSTGQRLQPLGTTESFVTVPTPIVVTP